MVIPSQGPAPGMTTEGEESVECLVPLVKSAKPGSFGVIAQWESDGLAVRRFRVRVPVAPLAG